MKAILPLLNVLVGVGLYFLGVYVAKYPNENLFLCFLAAAVGGSFLGYVGTKAMYSK